VTRSDAQRLARLRRLERMRAIAREAALAEAARAEGTLAQLAGLAERTRLLAAEYAARDDAGDAHALAGAMRFAAGMQGLTRNALAEADSARSLADAKARAAVEAERRRAAVDDRASRVVRAIARKGYATTPSPAPRKGGWHGS
jgi:hypothetical protein